MICLATGRSGNDSLIPLFEILLCCLHVQLLCAQIGSCVSCAACEVLNTKYSPGGLGSSIQLLKASYIVLSSEAKYNQLHGKPAPAHRRVTELP